MEKTKYNIPTLPLNLDLESKIVLKQVNLANIQLAGLRFISKKIPNDQILINTLVLQEAKESSAVENIITTHDEIYKASVDPQSISISSSTNEVLNYAYAIKEGFKMVKTTELLTNKTIQAIQKLLENNNAGFRSIPGTSLKNQKNETVYTPPQLNSDIVRHMDNLELFINDDTISDLDPLVKMAIIHHQFESIHPFFDGNGRTGRIINILYLILKDRQDIPILYLSRYIIRNKGEYYRLLQGLRDGIVSWEDWIVFMLKGVEETSRETIVLIEKISEMMQEYKHKMRPILGNTYRHELLNNLFNHPYTKIDFVMKDMSVSRITATRYLNKLIEIGLLVKVKMGKSNYYLNVNLYNLLSQPFEIDYSIDNIITVNPNTEK